jgi:hypothetical protein
MDRHDVGKEAGKLKDLFEGRRGGDSLLDYAVSNYLWITAERTESPLFGIPALSSLSCRGKKASELARPMLITEAAGRSRDSRKVRYVAIG